MKRILSIASLLLLAGSVLCSGAKKSTVNLSLTFSDGNKNYWPFVEKRVSYTVKTPSFSGEEVSFTARENSAVYKMKAAGGITINSKAGIRLSVASGDYIDLPVLPGMAPVKVSLVMGAKSKALEADLVASDGSALNGGGPKSMLGDKGDIIDWTLKGVKPGTPCRIAFNGTSSACFWSIDLTYEGVMPKVKKVKEPKTKGKVIALDFFNPETGKGAWPFDSRVISYGSNTAEADMVTEKLEEFSVKCSDKAYHHSTGAFCFGKLKYGYLMLPSFGTKALVKVVLVPQKSGGNGNLAVMRQSSWKIVEGGEATGTLKAEQPYEWNLTGTEAGERYRLVMTQDGIVTIKKLTLYYQ